MNVLINNSCIVTTTNFMLVPCKSNNSWHVYIELEELHITDDSKVYTEFNTIGCYEKEFSTSEEAETFATQETLKAIKQGYFDCTVDGIEIY